VLWVLGSSSVVGIQEGVILPVAIMFEQVTEVRHRG
jgi:hypothetical protein